MSVGAGTTEPARGCEEARPECDVTRVRAAYGPNWSMRAKHSRCGSEHRDQTAAELAVVHLGARLRLRARLLALVAGRRGQLVRRAASTRDRQVSPLAPEAQLALAAGIAARRVRCAGRACLRVLGVLDRAPL